MTIIKRIVNILNNSMSIGRMRKESQTIFDKRKSFAAKWGKDYLDVLRELTTINS